MWELDYKERWAPKNWCFWTVVLEKTLESPLDCRDIQPVNPKGDQSWVFIERPDAEAETPILWPPDAKDWLIWKDPDAGRESFLSMDVKLTLTWNALLVACCEMGCRAEELKVVIQMNWNCNGQAESWGFAGAKLPGVGDLVGKELARVEDTNQNFKLNWDDGVTLQ